MNFERQDVVYLGDLYHWEFDESGRFLLKSNFSGKFAS